MPKLNSLEVVHQDTNKDSYENLHDIIVSLKGARNQEMVDGEARALYETLLEMYVNDKEAFAKRVETLSAKFGNSIAQVVEEMLAYASASEAWAKRITKLSAELDAAKASISTESYVRVTEDEALASQITTLESTLGTDIASVQEYAETLATTKNRTFKQTSAPTTGMIAGDLWFDTDYNNKAYRYDGVSWVDTDDTRIATTYARWGVQVDAGGNVAGIQLNSSGAGTSNFIVTANNFKVYGTGGQTSIQNPLDVSVAGSTQRVGIGNAMIVYYEGTSAINRWAAINNVKCSGIYSRPTASAIVDLPYSWSNEAAGFFAGNAGTGGNYHGLRGSVFSNNSEASTLSRGIVGSHTGAAFFAEVGGYAPFTGEHQSVVNKGYEIQEGQIVVDKEIVMKKDISNTLSRVEKSNTINQKGVIGVFTRNNGPMSKISTLAVISEHRVDDGFGNLTGPLTEQYDQIKDLYDVVSVNALGEGQILVCGENGSISTGDLIVTSSVEGVGMKQADDVIRSYTVAKAREDVTFEDSTTPKLVPCIYLCG